MGQKITTMLGPKMLFEPMPYMCGSRGVLGRGPDHLLGKLQACMVPYQYWSGSHGKSQKYQISIQC